MKSGDFLAITRFDGVDQIIQYGAGSHSGHSAVVLEVDGDIPYLRQSRHSCPADAGGDPGASSSSPPRPEPADAGVHGPGGDRDAGVEPALSDEQEESLRERASSLLHLMTHRFKNKYCTTCMQSKLHAKPARPPGTSCFGRQARDLWRPGNC